MMNILEEAGTLADAGDVRHAVFHGQLFYQTVFPMQLRHKERTTQILQ